MIRECSFVLPSGRKCRCAATRHLAVCRHHAPKPAVSGPPPLPRRERYSHLMRWRELGRNLPWMPADEIPQTIYDILQCLVDRGQDSTGCISDLAAGRFLRALLNRLGDVPFADPDLAGQQLPAPAQPPSAADPREIHALLAALGMPPLQSPLHPSHARVNQ